jgi:hypothetical protein
VAQRAIGLRLGLLVLAMGLFLCAISLGPPLNQVLLVAAAVVLCGWIVFNVRSRSRIEQITRGSTDIATSREADTARKGPDRGGASEC